MTVQSIKPTKTVYSYYFPETRKLITDITKKFPHNVYLKSVNPGLDNFHDKAVNAYLENTKNQLQGLETFKYRYVSAGASEAIFHILANVKVFRSSTPLYILEGEYEGYKEYGRNLGLNFTVVKSIAPLNNYPKGIIFISNPSARDGNIIPNSQILKLANAGHKLIIDATYVGLTKPHRFFINHKNIETVIVSLSKPFGLYYHRIGFCFSNVRYETLEANKWFKNILSLIIAEKALKSFQSSELYSKYKDLQKLVVQNLKTNLKANVKASDVVLLAYLKGSNKIQGLEEFKRYKNYRFCLTPYFLNYEKNKNI